MSNFSDSNNFRSLLKVVESSPLVLFLGTGIMGNLIPKWDELLKSLLERAVPRVFPSEDYCCIKTLIPQIRAQFDYYRLASFVKAILGKHYVSFLRDALYERIGNYESQVSGCKYLQVVLELCRNERIHAVVTTNYDDILVRELNKVSPQRMAVPVYAYKQKVLRRSGKDHLPVYFVHGYIPSTLQNPQKAEVHLVFSADEYIEHILNPSPWQTTTQLYFLRNYPCLFLGSSLIDWNQLRLLDRAKKDYDHPRPIYAIYREKKPPEVCDRVNLHMSRCRSTVLHYFGVHSIIPGDNYQSIYDCVERLRDKLDEVVKTSSKQQSNNGGKNEPEQKY